MKFITLVGLLAVMVVPSAVGGVVRLDVDSLICYDWDSGAPLLGGRASFLIDESIADSDALPQRGRYSSALKWGMFHNYLSGESYLLDMDSENYLDIESVSDMYTGIMLRGAFKNKLGHSVLFDLEMEASYKPDDHLHTLKSSVQIWSNTVLFNLLAPMDYFESYGASHVNFKSVNSVPESTSWTILLAGFLMLAWRRFKAQF